MSETSRRNIRRTVVLGAGLMGSQIAALLASSGIEVDLLDVPSESGPDTNSVAATGLKSAIERKPPAFATPSAAERVRIGNLRDDLGRIEGADWVIEAVVENLALKQDLFARVDAVRKPGTIVSSNTSGMSITELARGRSPGFQREFLGTHFFNPPRYMTLFELIPTSQTDPELACWMTGFAQRRLGKGVIPCADTPLFIANRIGLFVRMCTIWTMIEEGLSLEAIDAICGPPLGRPKTGVFRLGDLVGLDTTANVARYLYSVATKDERREIFKLPPFIEKLLAEGALGNKAGRGFYRKSKGGGGESEIEVLDWKTGLYRKPEPFDSKSLEEARGIADPGERIARLVADDDQVGRFVWKTLSQWLVYAATRIGEITSFPASIDRALRWGYNWELGLFEIWDAIGVAKSVERMRRDGLAVPEVIDRMLASGRQRFYDHDATPPTSVDLVSGKAVPLDDPVSQVDLAALKRRRDRSSGRKFAGNEDATLWDIGDGARCLEFHTKMNTLGPGVVAMLDKSLDEAAQSGSALVIGGPATNFSAGANLRRMLDLARKGEWQTLDRGLQTVCKRLGRAGLPVVAAPAGLALGGGAEIVLRSPKVVAHRETNIGLVELRVGLIPGAGGATEMLRRAVGAIAEPSEAWPALKRAFDLIRESRVSTSAEEAVELCFLRSTDEIVPGRLLHLAEAKRAALELAERGVPPVVQEPEILALGADALARLRLGLHLARAGGYITEYDVVVGGKLAWIMCGGDLAAPRKMPEQYFLDLEREAFLSLLGDARTQARIEHLLNTGKPLRN